MLEVIKAHKIRTLFDVLATVFVLIFMFSAEWASFRGPDTSGGRGNYPFIGSKPLPICILLWDMLPFAIGFFWSVYRIPTTILRNYPQTASFPNRVVASMFAIYFVLILVTSLISSLIWG